MADEIRADYTQLQQVATQFSRQATAINRMQQQMKRSLSALQGNWIGHGSEAFFSEMRDKVLPATQRLADALRQAQKVTLQISQTLQAAEEDAARPFRRCAGLAAPGYASQHWGVEVHRDQTAIWARDLAIEVQESQSNSLSLLDRVRIRMDARKLANEIAQANQGVDVEATRHGTEDLIRSGDKRRWARTPQEELGGATPEQYNHYPSKAEAEARLMTAIKAKNPVAFGQALHSYQDYFSHTLNGFTASKGKAGIRELKANCPECFNQGVPRGELEDRAFSQEGHDLKYWADITWLSSHYDEMREGTQKYILLFMQNYYGTEHE